MQILFYDKTKINLILTHAFDFKKHLNFKALKTLNFLIKMWIFKKQEIFMQSGLSIS